MSHLYPKKETLQSSLYAPGPGRHLHGGPTPWQARPELYGAFSTSDDSKGKIQKIAAEATKDFEKASAKAQAQTGKIELYSGKFYAACTFGGLLACVSDCATS